MSARPLFTYPLLLLALAGAANAPAQTSQKPPVPVPGDGPEAVVSELVEALNTADVARFVACFAADATLFFPLPERSL